MYAGAVVIVTGIAWLVGAPVEVAKRTARRWATWWATATYAPTLTMLASNLASPSAIAADATDVYWTTIYGGGVMKVSRGGGIMTVLAAPDQAGGNGLAVGGGSAYWTTSNAVMRVALADRDPITVDSGTVAGAITTDNENVYWLSHPGRYVPFDTSCYFFDATISKAPLGGGTPTVLASGISYNMLFFTAKRAGSGVTCRDAEGSWLHGRDDPWEGARVESETIVGENPELFIVMRPGLGYLQHIKSGKLPAGSKVTAREVKGGKTAREIAEQRRINELGGIKNLENKVNPIGPKRQHLLRG